MTRTTVVIPLRGLHGGKSRLAPLLDPPERATLIAAMGRHVIDAVLRSHLAGSILLVSREQHLLPALGLDHPIVRIAWQPETSIGLNAALDLGRRRAIADGADRLIVLSADLPLLTPEDVAHLASASTAVVLGPDRRGTGTNALALRGDAAVSGFPFLFGIGSHGLHEAAARKLGGSCADVDSPGLSLDLDTPGDWDMLPDGLRRQLLDSRTSASAPAYRVSGLTPAAFVEGA